MILVPQIPLLIAVGCITGYLVLLSFLALFNRRPMALRATRCRRFAVVVPAHNEEISIAKTVASLLSVDYPPDRFEVIVVADNCDDRTADLARASGATVFERTDDRLRGKGYALRWCFDRILTPSDDYEAVVIIDADTVVSNNLLTVFNAYLEKGALVLQCNDTVAKEPGVWSSEMTRLSFTLYNFVRPLGRRPLRCSAGLRGNGMCLSSGILREFPWQAYSLAEDYEFGLQLLSRGILVTFAPEGTVYATMPKHARNAESQRARWEQGKFPLIRRYAARLLIDAFTRPSFAAFDAFLDLVTPPIVNLMLAAAGLAGANGLLFVVGFEEAGILSLVWLAMIVGGLIHVLVGLVAAGADRNLYGALLFLPQYVFWKVLLYTKLVRQHNSGEWIRTTREHLPRNVPSEPTVGHKERM